MRSEASFSDSETKQVDGVVLATILTLHTRSAYGARIFCLKAILEQLYGGVYVPSRLTSMSPERIFCHVRMRPDACLARTLSNVQSTPKLLKQVDEFIKMLARVWSDVRMPLHARLMLLLAPIYLLCPYDLNPDFLPGGYADDLWIVPILIAVGAKLVPKVVFQDARKAATQAVCGILCIGLVTASSQQNADRALAFAKHTNQVVIASCINAEEFPTGFFGIGKMSTMPECNSTNALRLQITDAVTAKKAFSTCGMFKARSSQACNFARRPSRHSINSKIVFSATSEKKIHILIARGGQFQLYGAESDFSAAALPLFNSLIHSKFLPPANTGGFFVLNSTTNRTFTSLLLVENPSC